MPIKRARLAAWWIRNHQPLTFSALNVAAALSLAVLFVILNSRWNDLRQEQDQAREAQVEFCQATNKSRRDSNKEIRIPLRETTFTIASILEQSAKRQTDPRVRAIYPRLAQQFRGYGNRVRLLSPLDCKAEG